ncbi:C40 family peptidase [Ureibacillus thermosphaericus]|uniref:Cell wall-associated NlpC family hydrolase n=1 Tax=Ureibacillus thermosphaericus TaxID=51173 RepID=A0A840PXW5_URETH|nr:C40 family peptidase [Ureibacillus thermosphaericus]MBB5149058.1 cell wall-associated NlpC family hydrolase [Ureibacillus thermosphaericus]
MIEISDYFTMEGTIIFQKNIRKLLLATVAGVVICFSPIAVGATEKDSTDFTSTELRETAIKYLGIRYLYGGTSTSGFDCSGFVRKVFSDLGIELPRTAKEMYEIGEPVKIGEIRPGDLLFYNTSGLGISHVAIYYGDGKMIHAQTGEGVSLSNFFDQYYWYDRFVGAKRVADVELISEGN